ncbi:MAG: cyclodeaminase/cyclohydrolase family protein [Lachnospiraceae bacterium]|nr:cyclodeaminase/cyclohydrolase family protein [Lachnospiraceae bacterium]
MEGFLKELSGSAPTPGGGGASALMGALSAALGSMVGNLTVNRKKYAFCQADMERLLGQLEEALWEIYGYIEKDAKAFAPLAAAYRIPKEDPDRERILEEALWEAAVVPLELTQKIYDLIPALEELEEKGNVMAMSDVAVAAAACRAAMEGAVMNVYINAGMMKDRAKAQQTVIRARELVEKGSRRCQSLYERIEKRCLKEVEE